jgi:hypothetical protein
MVDESYESPIVDNYNTFDNKVFISMQKVSTNAVNLWNIKS